LIEHRGKIVTGRIIRRSSRSHLFSMRDCRPFGLKGISHMKCQGSANPNDRLFAEGAKAGRQHACTFDTLMIRSLNRAYRLQEPGAGVPPMTATVLPEAL